MSVRSYGEEPSEEAVRVTRSIMIVKPPGYQTGSPPVSPAGSTPPVSPFSGKLAKCWKCPCTATTLAWTDEGFLVITCRCPLLSG